MGINFDFVILTVNNRGVSSALNLMERGYKVAWLDVSEKTCWSSKDFSGPLPFHIPREVDEKDKRVFLSTYQTKKVPQGLSLITEEGVVELNGEISDHQISRFRQQDDLSQLQNSYSPTVSALSKNLKDHWLVHFFASYNKSLVDGESLVSKQTLNVSDMFGETYVATENFSHRQKNRKHLEAKGVEVLDSEDFEIRLEAGKYYIRTSSGKMSSASQMLCFLESSDIHKLDPELSQQIFHKKPRESDWRWLRLNLDWKADVDVSCVPDIVILLNHWDLPWLEENFMIMRKASDENWGLWVKVKKEPFYVPAELLNQFADILNKKFPQSYFSMTQPPLQDGLNLELFPVYQERPELMIKKGANFYPMGFDKFDSFDQFDMFLNQKQFVDQLLRRPS